MNISSNLGVSSYVTMSKASALPSIDKTPSPAVTRTSTSSASESISLSTVAEKLAAAPDTGATQQRTAAQERILRTAYADPGLAEKMASEMAAAPSQIAYNIRDSDPSLPRPNRLTDGTVIDATFESNFGSHAPAIDAGRRALYDAEVSKGTDPADIINKMINYTNSQSADYLRGRGFLSADDVRQSS